MAELDPKRLARVLRVRALQRDLAQAEALKAAEQAERQAELVRRIGRLADETAPAHGASSGIDLAAGAGFRTRLHASHRAATTRLSTAEALAVQQQAHARQARQDHGVIEKLIDRAEARIALADMRKLAEAPHFPRRGTGLAETDGTDG